MRPLTSFLAILRLTALEAIRRPVFLLISLAGIGGIILLPLLLNYTLGDSFRIIRDSALGMYLAGGFLLAALSAAETFARDLRRGSAAIILAKPVPRPAYFLAKAAGIAGALLMFTLASASATMLAIRAGAPEIRLDWTAAGPALAALLLAPLLAGIWNHRTRRPFTSAAFFALLGLLLLATAFAALHPTPFDHLSFPHNFHWPVLSVMALLYFALAMAGACAATLATRLPPPAVLLITTGLFLLGLMSDYFFGPRLAASPLARMAYTLIPNVQVFWLTDALDFGTVPLRYLTTAGLYAAGWSIAVLSGGILSICHREISE